MLRQRVYGRLPGGRPKGRRERSALIRGTGVVGVVVPVLLAGGLLAGFATSGDPEAGEPAGTASPQSSTSPSSVPTGGSHEGSEPFSEPSRREGADASEGGNVGIVALDPVEVGNAVAVADGTTVWVTGVREVELEGRGPGEIHGPGVAVTVEIRNGSTSPLDLNGTTVNASFGDLPASPSSASPSAPLHGELRPGKTAQGTYTFMKPDGSKGPVRIEIQNTSWPEIVVVQVNTPSHISGSS